MTISRRRFFQIGALGTIGTVAPGQAASGQASPPEGPAADPSTQTEELDRVAAEPVLKLPAELDQPVIIDRVELLRNRGEYLVRVRSTDGAEGIAATSSGRFGEAWPVFLHRVAPFFEGKDARMAAHFGIPCSPHMSGWGIGYLDMLHFVSAMPTPGAFQEYKGPSSIPFECDTSSLRPEEGSIRVPGGPGFGIEIDPGFLAEAEKVTL